MQSWIIVPLEFYQIYKYMYYYKQLVKKHIDTGVKDGHIFKTEFNFLYQNTC